MKTAMGGLLLQAVERGVGAGKGIVNEAVADCGNAAGDRRPWAVQGGRRHEPVATETRRPLDASGGADALDAELRRFVGFDAEFCGDAGTRRDLIAYAN